MYAWKEMNKSDCLGYNNWNSRHSSKFILVLRINFVSKQKGTEVAVQRAHIKVAAQRVFIKVQQ